MDKTIGNTRLTVGASVGLLILMAFNARGYFHTPDDLLFYDRLVVTALVAWRLRRTVWCQRTTFFLQTRISWKALLCFILLFVAACLTESRTAMVYLTLVYASGLVLIAKGHGALRRMTPFLSAIGIMSYPPRLVWEPLTAWSQSLCLAATQKICEYLLPEARFAANNVIVGETVIAFDPECGGIHLVCTMMAMALVFGSKIIAFTMLFKVVIITGLLALALNILRVVCILALTVFGYAEEALFEMHHEIGHRFAFFGILTSVGLIRWYERKFQVRSYVSPA